MTDLDQFDFSSYAGMNGQLLVWRYDHLSQYFRGDSCLELGSSDGAGTQLLAKHFKRVVAVDGSANAVRELALRFGGTQVEAVHSNFEDLKRYERFDTIVAAHILEHVDDPGRVLAVAKQHLAPGGVIIADVPNAWSIHRQVGVQLGLLKRVTDLNDADRSIGHVRVYTADSFKAEIKGAGCKIDHFGGMLMKPLSSAQMEANGEEINRAFFEIGQKYPEIAAEIYVVATALRP